MRVFSRTTALLLVALASAPVVAAERVVQMQAPAALRAGIAAMPRIAGPVDEAETRINKALDHLDGNVRKAARECRMEKGKPGDWERIVTTPMRGPAYLSYFITDSIFCGGAYPSASQMAIVYDLKTGAPVDWTRLLPKSLTGKVELQQLADGTKMVSLSSPRLFALYMEQYAKGAHKGDKECVEALKGYADNLPMQVWLDAKIGGLGLVFDVPHVISACVEEAVIPLAALRAEGAAPGLLAAIQAAHDADKAPGKR